MKKFFCIATLTVLFTAFLLGLFLRNRSIRLRKGTELISVCCLQICWKHMKIHPTKWKRT